MPLGPSSCVLPITSLLEQNVNQSFGSFIQMQTHSTCTTQCRHAP